MDTTDVLTVADVLNARHPGPGDEIAEGTVLNVHEQADGTLVAEVNPAGVDEGHRLVTVGG